MPVLNICRPHFCVTQYVLAQPGSLYDGILMLERDVVLVFQTSKASSHSRDKDGMRGAPP
eukprot:4155927-Amphidinium_carterae.1